MNQETAATLLLISPAIALWLVMSAAEVAKTISAIREGRHEI